VNVSLSMDVNVPIAITEGLRRRGVDVVTAQEDGANTLADPDLLDRASLLGRVLVTHDDDFLIEAARRLATGVSFADVIYAHQLGITIGRCVRDLELIATLEEPEKLADRVVHLPL